MSTSKRAPDAACKAAKRKAPSSRLASRSGERTVTRSSAASGSNAADSIQHKNSVAVLAQNPHAVRGGTEKRLEDAIGLEVRTLRKQQGLTVADLGEATGLSPGMLSKIENGLTSPSLTTLQSLAHALGVSISAFLRRFEEEHAVAHVKAGEGVDVGRRGSRAGHQYQLLGYLGTNSSGVTAEPYMITLTRDSDVFPTFQHEGVEYLYMLEGRIDYRHGDKTYLMEPGDSLFFDANAPHGPERLIKLPARYLAIIAYPQNTSQSAAPNELSDGAEKV